MDDINVKLAKVIRALRKQSLLSQEGLAEIAGVHRTYISQIERGIKSPTLVVIFKIAKGLNVSVSEMMHQVEDCE